MTLGQIGANGRKQGEWRVTGFRPDRAARGERGGGGGEVRCKAWTPNADTRLSDAASEHLSPADDAFVCNRILLKPLS